MKRNMGLCAGCWISVMSALLALLLIPLQAQANSVLGNMTESASPSNSTSVPAESEGVKLDDEMSKPVSNMFLILRSGRKPRDGGELGSGLQEDDHPLTSTPTTKEMTTEDLKISPDSAETDHLLPEVIKKDLLPSASTKSPWHGTDEKMESTVFDLDENQDSVLDRQEPPTTMTPFPTHSPSHTEFLTVDFFDTRSHVNELVPPSPTAHELQGREPTAWAMPNNYDYLTPYDQTVSPTSEEATTKPDEYEDDLTTTPPPPPPRTFRPHFPNSFIPAREEEPPANRNKVGKSSSAECWTGSMLVNGTCKSQCDMMPNYCFNGGQCFVLEGAGVFCRCNIQDYVWHKGARCESVITEFQVMCIAIGASALTVLLLFMIIVCFAKKLHVLKTENNKLRKRSSKYRPSSEQHNDNFSLSTIAEGSNPNVRKLCDSPPHARALAYYDNIICQDDPNSQNKLEDAVKSPPPKEDESLNIQNSLTPKHENHKVLGEENSSEVNSLQNNMM
ncbi:chondroitin sulfate proteoglycan 5 isoform X4 [Pangasianodon hypophthalmus]|uniref:chondroitin sulfate proteoglycan 5 isoform X4 n=1 Tax=Pangasianodon hypophthalmus TaxID=310915 RepID=UPI000F0062A9|nr:chondroitin sulfate proteoglycan 5 isoform X4 [Pangasianodon hypophthalmus]